jgi:homoserine O-succinyltransferase/O-acetyltransferase
MRETSVKNIKVAILDLYEGAPNQGMRCIKEILTSYGATNQIALSYDIFDVRLKNEVPDLSYDIYISTGGPGSPVDSFGSEWEKKYFSWLETVLDSNNALAHKNKKHVLFICHSFQMACRFFGVGHVTQRKSTSFGVFPVHLIEQGPEDPVFEGLGDPFYAVDSRDYQVISPDREKLDEIGGAVLAIEKERPHVPLERAVMAIRFNPCMLGTQFHPEADPEGMSMYLQRADKKEAVIGEHGFEKWQSMIEQLNDPEKIRLTYSNVLPNFLDRALGLS